MSSGKPIQDQLLGILKAHVEVHHLKAAKERCAAQKEGDSQAKAGGLFYIAAEMQHPDQDSMRQCRAQFVSVLEAIITSGLKNFTKAHARGALNQFNLLHGNDLFLNVKCESWALRQMLNHVRYTESRVVDGKRLPNAMKQLVAAWRSSVGKEPSELCVVPSAAHSAEAHLNTL